MTVWIWGGAVSFLSNLAIGLWVLSRNPASRINRLFALFSLCVSGWSVGSFFENVIQPESAALAALRFNYLFGIWLPAVFVFYIHEFVRKTLKTPRFVTAATLAASACLTPFVFLDSFIPRLHELTGGYRISSPGPVYYVFFVYFAVTMIYGLACAWRASRLAAGEESKQFSYLFVANAIAIVAGLEYFSRVFGMFKSPPYDDYILIAYLAVLAYAMLKHGLMDVRIGIQHTAYYSILTYMVSVLYAAVVFIGHLIISGRYSVGSFNAFTLSSIMTAITALGLGIFILKSDPRKNLFRIWFVLCFCVFLWGAFGAFISVSNDPEASLRLWNWAMVTGVFWVPVFFLHFVYEMLDRKRRALLWVSYLVTFAFCLVTLHTPYFYGTTRLVFNSFYYPVPATPLPFINYFLWMGCFWHGIFILFKSYDSVTAGMKTKITYLCLAAGVGGVGGSLNFLPFFGLDVYPWGNFLVALFPFIMTYAMIAHELFDIRIVLKKTLLYSPFVILLSLIYVALIFGAHHFLMSKPSGEISLGANLLVILIIASVFKPIEALLRKLLDKKFFKGSIEEISTHNQRLASELERRERLKSVGILASGMAHEIKNPITAIRTFAEYLPARHGDAEFMEKFSRIVASETGRIEKLVKELLVFSKPAEPVIVAFDLHEQVRGVVELLTGDLIKRGIEVRWDLQSAGQARADSEQIKQAVLNIIINAMDAMPKGGVLTVGSRSADGLEQLWIADTGVGISAESMKHIFDPFYTNKDLGTGLGLAITHSLIERNKGRIEVSSKVGVGTKFVICVPKSDRSEAAP